MFMKRRLIYITAAITAAVTIIICVLLSWHLTEQTIRDNGYIPLEKAMKAAGYTDCGDGKFKTDSNGIGIEVYFDFTNDICTKNLYSFDISGKYIIADSSYFIDSKTAGDITNKNITVSNGKITAQDIDFAPHQWTTEFAPVVAHSGGDVRAGTYTDYYTNSLEGIVQNYDLGFRVFEMDFYLTNDDWEHYANYDGTAPSAEQWLEMKTHGYPQTEGVYYTSMLIGDLLDQMMINKDMFVITDTKSFEVSEQETRRQFEIIRDEATKRDPNLLKRIIPQIYNEEMYAIIMDIYNFQDVIYTLYASASTAARAAEFVSDKENIKVITVRKTDERFLNSDIAGKLKPYDKLIYVHTIKYYNEFADCAKYGAYGFYAHHLTPADYETFAKYR